jgi:hypothetical protein
MKTRELHEVHDLGTFGGKIIFQKMQERFKASHQTDANGYPKSAWRHPYTQKSMPEENQNEQSALRSVARLDAYVVLQRPITKGVVVDGSNEYGRQQNENCSHPIQDFGGILAQTRALYHRRIKEFLNDSEVKGHAAGSAKEIEFHVQPERHFQEVHGEKNNKLQKFKEQIREEDWELFLSYLPEHHDCDHKKQHMRDNPEVKPQEALKTHTREHCRPRTVSSHPAALKRPFCSLNLGTNSDLGPAVWKRISIST